MLWRFFCAKERSVERKQYVDEGHTNDEKQ